MKNRVLLEEYSIFNVVIPLEVEFGVYFTTDLVTGPLGHVIRVALDGTATKFATFPGAPDTEHEGAPSPRVGDDCVIMEGAGMLRDQSSGHLFFYGSGVIGETSWWVELDAQGQVLRNTTVTGHYEGLVQASDGHAYGIDISPTGEDSLVRVDLQSLASTTVQAFGDRMPALGDTALDADVRSLVTIFDEPVAHVLTTIDLKTGTISSANQLPGIVWAMAAETDVATEISSVMA